MPLQKNTKTKTKATTKKTTRSRTKKTTKVSELAQPIGILVDTKISGSSITHGHAPYEHQVAQHNFKKLDDRSKNLIMYIGVSLIMVIIVVVWIINLKKTLGPDAFSMNVAQPENQTNFNELKNNLNQTLQDVKDEISTLEEQAKTKPNTPTSTATFIPTTTVVPTMTSSPTNVVKPTFNTLPN